MRLGVRQGCLGQPKRAPTRAPVAGTTLEGKASVACVPCCCHPCLVQSWQLSETRFTETQRISKRSETQRSEAAPLTTKLWWLRPPPLRNKNITDPRNFSNYIVPLCKLSILHYRLAQDIHKTVPQRAQDGPQGPQDGAPGCPTRAKKGCSKDPTRAKRGCSKVPNPCQKGYPTRAKRGTSRAPSCGPCGPSWALWGTVLCMSWASR